MNLNKHIWNIIVDVDEGILEFIRLDCQGKSNQNDWEPLG